MNLIPIKYTQVNEFVDCSTFLRLGESKDKSWDNTLSRFLPTSFYIKFIDEISSKYMSIILSTDGFYRAALSLKKTIASIDLTVAEIEAKLTEFYFGALNYPSLSIMIPGKQK